MLTGMLGLSTDGLLFGGYGFSMTGLTGGPVGDDGGWQVIVSGVFPLTQGVYVDVLDTATGIRRACTDGTPGTRELLRSTTGGTLTIYVPAMPVGGPYDLVGVSEDGIFTSTLTAALSYIHRSFTTRLYSLRSAWPPPRAVGPYSIDGED
tara:strand:- start:116 stop:565 length:450 start_codon:yes stop_codon:yes gene_type:complete